MAWWTQLKKTFWPHLPAPLPPASAQGSRRLWALPWGPPGD
jgi:hypothetical protein